jgi:uncharacterized membrane protein HdeD (DUF308 family)
MGLPMDPQPQGELGTRVPELRRGVITMLSRFWWALLLRGIAAVVFAVVLWCQPRAGLAALVLSLGAYMLLDGSVSIVNSLGGRKDNENWRWMLGGGVLSALLGLLTLFAPHITAFALIYFTAVWALLVGSAQFVIAVRIRDHVQKVGLLYLGGGVSLLLGVFLLWNPRGGLAGVMWVVATFAFVFGLIVILAALGLRALAGKAGERVKERIEQHLKARGPESP